MAASPSSRLTRWALPIKAWRSRRTPPTPASSVSRFREIGSDRLDEFLRNGFHQRHVFSHRLYYVPRAGSDGLKLARSIYEVSEAHRLRQLVLFATGPALEGIPSELFFDDDLVWHQQHLGLPGHVAVANLVIRGRTLLTTARFSDIVQRISRRPEALTRVEKRFRGWDHMLLNGILGYAVERDLETIRFPTARTMMANTDPARAIGESLFERIYDHDVRERFDAERKGQEWVVDVRRNRHRLVTPMRREERLSPARTICVCHDVERSSENLRRILEVEARRGVRGTYNVAGCFMNGIRADIERAGPHEISFHSYDHTDPNQLAACRNVDNRIKGYRPPRSRLTAELTDNYLAFYNFEWLASSPRSIRAEDPGLRGGIAYVPIRFDDLPIYHAEQTFDTWQQRVVAMVRAHDVTAFGLHDRHAHLWLDRFDELLGRLQDLGRLETVGEVANRTVLGSAE